MLEVEHLHEVRIAIALDQHDVLGLEIAGGRSSGRARARRRRDLGAVMWSARPSSSRPGAMTSREASALDVLEREEERAVLEACREVRSR